MASTWETEIHVRLPPYEGHCLTSNQLTGISLRSLYPNAFRQDFLVLGDCW